MYKVLIAFVMAFSALEGTTKEQYPPPFLLILVDAPQTDYEDFQSFLRDAYARFFQSTNAVGHCWIYLEGWHRGSRICIEGGHSGEGGQQPRYLDGVMDLIQYGYVAPTPAQKCTPRHEADPIKYLWHRRQDGYFQNGSGGHKPSFVAMKILDDESFERLLTWIIADEYNYREYSLIEHHCVHFVVEALRIAGEPLEIALSNIAIPPTIRWGGEPLRLRTNGVYSVLSLKTPSSLVIALKKAVAQKQLLAGEHIYLRVNQKSKTD